MNNGSNKVFVLGIDGAPPQYLFDKWIDELPNLKNLMKKGLYSRIQTTIPPSTCVAWTSFFSGKEPSQFGVYSYSVREGFAYSASRLVNSRDVRTNMIWDTLTKHNKKSIILGVPLTYPIEKSVNGSMITGFLTPSMDTKSIYPSDFYSEIKSKFPDYMFDVNVGLASYKKEGKDELIEKVYKMTKQVFDITEHCLKTKDWDLFATILIGSDRLEHSFWSYFDPTHRLYKGDTRYKNVLKDFMIFIDKQLGKIISMLPSNTTIIVSSDHGMDKMNCRFNLNDWLISKGYLILKSSSMIPVKLKMSDVDWTKTKAFSVGAYFGRIYFNLEGREPDGIVPIEDYDSLQKEISNKLRIIRDDHGNEMDNIIHLPQDLYKGEFSEEAPDIIVYFDNLICGVNNDVGNKGYYTWATTVGSDDAGHAEEGIFIMSGNNVRNLGEINKINITDITPTILNILSIPIDIDIVGKIIEHGDTTNPTSTTNTTNIKLNEDKIQNYSEAVKYG